LPAVEIGPIVSDGQFDIPHARVGFYGADRTNRLPGFTAAPP